MRHSHRLHQFRSETEEELKNILSCWQRHAIDYKHGGFYGKIDNDNHVVPNADKGSVLNGRILWAFSSAYIFLKDETYRETASRACKYIIQHFIDPQYGGVYWTVDEKGNPAETKKQVYASAFVLYGLSEFTRAWPDEEVKQQAIQLYNNIVEHAYDKLHGGFFEAFTSDWKTLDDQRLSGKDANEKKSMNTNLHVLEAFTNLFRTWPDENVKNHIRDLLNIFSDKIIDAESGHLRLFFDEQWNNKPSLISYGHDIEGAWLLLECAEVIENAALIDVFKRQSISLTNAAMMGLDDDGGLWYEYDLKEKKLIREKHWWPQAEAIVGFFNAWQISGEQHYLDASFHCWNFIKSHMLNPSGEWFWGINEDGSVMQKQDKIGLWKCPYHNSRGCLEIIKRITSADPSPGSQY